MVAGALKLSTTSVLVVDDDPLVVRALSRAFRAEGLTVHSCQRGEDAVRRLWEIQPDVLVVDLFLPDIDGVTVCLVACQLPRRPVIVFISGQSDPGHRVRALEAGADDFMVKPIDFRELRMRIALRQRGRSGIRPLSTRVRDPLASVSDPELADCSGLVLETPESAAPGQLVAARPTPDGQLFAQQRRGRGHLLLIDSSEHDLKCLDAALSARGFGVTPSLALSDDFGGPEVVWLRAGQHAQAQLDELRARGYAGPVLVSGASTAAFASLRAEGIPGVVIVRFPCRLREIDDAIVRVLPEGRRSQFGTHASDDATWLGDDIRGIRAALTKTEELLFARLTAANGALVERHELSRLVLGVTMTADRSLDRHASTLRAKLELFCLYLVTHRGKGYSIRC